MGSGAKENQAHVFHQSHRPHNEGNQEVGSPVVAWAPGGIHRCWVQGPGDILARLSVLPQVGSNRGAPLWGAASRLGCRSPAASWDLSPGGGFCQPNQRHLVGTPAGALGRREGGQMWGG